MYMSEKIYTIEEIKAILKKILKNMPVYEVILFGSYAKNNADKNSDLDFIMDTDGLIGMIQYCAIIRRLEEKFGCHVDLITTGCSDREFLSRIQNEEVLIYER